MRHNVMVSVSQILNAGKSCLRPLKTSQDSHTLIGVTTPESTLEGYLHFASDVNQLKVVPAGSGWIITEALQNKPEMQSLLDQAVFVAITPHISQAMSAVLSLFDRRHLFNWDDFVLRNGAWVHSTAEIDLHVKLYPGSVIGAGCTIGAHSEIRPNVTLEPLTHIGSDCLIHSGTVIGSDGFGFFKDPKSQVNFKIPQIGNVTISKMVEIGSNCSIDRATLLSTSIDENTKLDNLVHISHNTRIGKGCFLAAGFMCAGSITIGDNFACGGDVVVSDHVRICDNVTIGGRSAVTKDITQPGYYLGHPLEPWKEGLRTLSNLTHVTELRKDLNEIKKKLNKGE